MDPLTTTQNFENQWPRGNVGIECAFIHASDPMPILITSQDLFTLKKSMERVLRRPFQPLKKRGRPRLPLKPKLQLVIW